MRQWKLALIIVLVVAAGESAWKLEIEFSPEFEKLPAARGNRKTGSRNFLPPRGG
jgi:hypothetical protein